MVSDYEEMIKPFSAIIDNPFRVMLCYDTEIQRALTKKREAEISAAGGDSDKIGKKDDEVMRRK